MRKRFSLRIATFAADKTLFRMKLYRFLLPALLVASCCGGNKALRFIDGDNVCTVADVLSVKDLEKAAKSIADRVISIGDANKPARSSTPPEPASKPPGTCNRKSPTSKNKTA